MREILRNAAKEESQPAAGLGSRIAARFRRVGLTVDLPELRGHLSRPAEFGGKRQRALEASFDRLVQEDLENRIADFDATAAHEAAALAAARQKAGRHVDLRDTQIAGIAVARRATLATRNVKYFQGLKITVVDPWKA